MKAFNLGYGLWMSFALVSVGTAQIQPAAPAAAVTSDVSRSIPEETGLAAVYSDKLAGHVTASGKKYDPNKLTAAHKTLPFGTHVRVTNTKNGKSVVLRITDRGPRQANRILDITPRAAHSLGIRKTAMGEVKLIVIDGDREAQ